MKIEFYENGPMIVTNSDLAIIEKDNVTTLLKDGPIALCRCGESRNKPFCDGGHVDHMFDGAGCVLRSTVKGDS